MSDTGTRLEYVEAELDRLKFEVGRSLNIDLSGKTPDANIPPQPERRVTDLGRPVLAAAGPPASYETQDGPDSTGAPASLPPVQEGVKPGTGELIVDSGGGQGAGPVVETVDDTDATEAAQRKADELGVTLADVRGTGADGRVTVSDVEKHADKQA
jgi:pyruvate/2-oxoglutarate dehydrogenase complex dihydrolipoamide acyltransferase (E2) component